MATRVLIPTPLRAFTGGRDTIDLEGATIGDLLKELIAQHADLRRHLYSDEGKLRSFVNIYLNDEDIRYLSREATPVKPGDTVSIIPSVAGGSGAAVKDAPVLNPEEVQRYSRHLILPEVGMDGQKKLKAARVLCIGAGGLGSPATMYLAAAGVGTIGLVDFDTGNGSKKVYAIGRNSDLVHGVGSAQVVDLESTAWGAKLFKCGPYSFRVRSRGAYPNVKVTSGARRGLRRNRVSTNDEIFSA